MASSRVGRRMSERMGPRLPLVEGAEHRVHLLDHGDQEAEGLAGAGGGGGENVGAFERGRDGSGLDGRGDDEVRGGEARFEGVGDVEIVEVDGGRVSLGDVTRRGQGSGVQNRFKSKSRQDFPYIDAV